jgi:hypothetical protein
MSRIAFNGNALGTGTVTIASPNTNSDRTITLPDATGTLITNSGTEAISAASLTVSGATTTGSLTVNSNNISAVNSLGFRNRLINGDCRIDQRNAGASVTPNLLAYPVDRTFGFGSVTGKFSCQQNSGGVTPPFGFTNYIGAVSLSAYSVPSGEQYIFGQPIEGLNVADLGWGAAGAQTVTLSFWVRSSLTGTFGGSLQNSAFDRSYPFSYTISAANTWEQKSVTIPGDTSGTWLKTNGVGIRLGFSLGAGSTLSGTAGAWAGSNFVSATGATSVVGTNGATFYITGVQLEAGSVASPFERVDYGRQLIQCQRYYETSFNGIAPGAAGSIDQYNAYSHSSTTLLIITYKVNKRTSPSSVTVWNPANANVNKVRDGNTGTEVSLNGYTTIGPTMAAIGTTAGGSTWYQFGYAVAAEL